MIKPLKFTQTQILGLIPAQAILDYDRAKDVLERVAQEVQRDILRQVVELVEVILEDWEEMTNEEGGEERWEEKYGYDTTELVDVILIELKKQVEEK